MTEDTGELAMPFGRLQRESHGFADEWKMNERIRRHSNQIPQIICTLPETETVFSALPDRRNQK
ncbi:MAG: hypothetical protein R3D45_00770 [Rhizobiaceae bacterium]